MSQFIPSFTNARTMQKIDFQYQHGNITLIVSAKGKVDGSRLDAETEYQYIKCYWRGRDVWPLIEHTDLGEAIYEKLDEAMSAERFEPDLYDYEHN